MHNNITHKQIGDDHTVDISLAGLLSSSHRNDGTVGCLLPSFVHYDLMLHLLMHQWLLKIEEYYVESKFSFYQKQSNIGSEWG